MHRGSNSINPKAKSQSTVPSTYRGTKKLGKKFRLATGMPGRQPNRMAARKDARRIENGVRPRLDNGRHTGAQADALPVQVDVTDPTDNLQVSRVISRAPEQR